MISVASGPRNSDHSHHQKPERYLPWARPELISERANHPTAYPPLVGLTELTSTTVRYALTPQPRARTGLLPLDPFLSRRGRATSSPLQFGQTYECRRAQSSQNVHSKLQM